jgi:hypothetical protein
VPWGFPILHNATDMHQVYQYRAFGVPGLGFKRGLGRPGHCAYASALALTVMPQKRAATCRSADHGFLGAYGFTRSRLHAIASRAQHAIVRSFMAHHQA